MPLRTLAARGVGSSAPALAAVAASLAVGAAVVAVSPTSTPPFALVVGSLTIAIVALPIVRRLATRKFDLLEPILPACLMLGILFGARPISMVTSENLTLYRGNYDVSPFFDRVTVMGFLGTACFIAGYELLATAPLRSSGHGETPSSAPGISRRRFRSFAIAAWTLGVGLFAVHLQLGGSILGTTKLLLAGRSPALREITSSSSEYLTAAPILVVCVAITLVALRGGSRMTRGEKTAAFASAALPAILALLLGNRRFVIPSAAIPVVVYFLASQRRPSLKAVLIVVPVVFIALSTIILARSEGARSQGGGVVPIFKDAYSNPADAWTNFIEGNDTSMVAWLAVEVSSLDQTSHYSFGNATLGDFVLAPIPSQLFPKPVTARDALLIDTTGGRCIDKLCPDFSVIGTFYQDFSYPGIVLGMFLLGLGAAWTWRRFLRAPHDPTAIVLTASVGVFLPILIRAGFMPPFAWFLYFLIPSMIGLRISSARSSHDGEAEPVLASAVSSDARRPSGP